MLSKYCLVRELFFVFENIVNCLRWSEDTMNLLLAGVVQLGGEQETCIRSEDSNYEAVESGNGGKGSPEDGQKSAIEILYTWYIVHIYFQSLLYTETGICLLQNWSINWYLAYHRQLKQFVKSLQQLSRSFKSEKSVYKIIVAIESIATYDIHIHLSNAVGSSSQAPHALHEMYSSQRAVSLGITYWLASSRIPMESLSSMGEWSVYMQVLQES